MIWKTMEVTFKGRHCETPTVVCTSQYLEKPWQVTAHISFLKTHAPTRVAMDVWKEGSCADFQCSQCSRAESEGARKLAIYN